MKITKYGTIEGGVCDNKHQDRALREKGAKLYLMELEKRQSLKSTNGWLRIAKLLSISEKEIMHFGVTLGANAEIGYRRFRSSVIEPFYEQKKSFRREQLEKWLEDICSFESNGLSYSIPIQDSIYKQKKEAGEFEE